MFRQGALVEGGGVAAVSSGLSVRPAWWRGGGAARARAGARALNPGPQLAQYRVLSSTGLVRTLHVLADALLYSPEHITLLVN